MGSPTAPILPSRRSDCPGRHRPGRWRARMGNVPAQRQTRLLRGWTWVRWGLGGKVRDLAGMVFLTLPCEKPASKGSAELKKGWSILTATQRRRSIPGSAEFIPHPMPPPSCGQDCPRSRGDSIPLPTPSSLRSAEFIPHPMPNLIQRTGTSPPPAFRESDSQAGRTRDRPSEAG